MPNLVRALEGLILPDKGKTTLQFKNRASVWWPKKKQFDLFDSDKHKTLEEIYDMRCDFDHLHGVKDVYDKTGIKRVQECEELARIAYKSILLENNIIKCFENENNIRNYWKKNIG